MDSRSNRRRGLAHGICLVRPSSPRSSPAQAAAVRTSRRRAPCATRRCSRAEPSPASPPPTKTTFTTWTAACRSPRSRSKGATCGSSGRAATIGFWDVLGLESFGSLDFLKTVSSHPTLPYSRDTGGTISGWSTSPASRRRPARPESLRPLARRPRPGLPARPVRQRRQIQGGRDRRARQDSARRLLLRRADRHRRPAAVSRIRRSTRTRARNGTRSATTATRATTSRRTS